MCYGGGVTACSNGSDSDGDDGKDKGDEEVTTKLVENFSLSGITLTEPGVTVAKGEVFANLEESDKVAITITYNTSATKLDEWDTWYCYTIDGENWKGDFEKTDGKTSVTITGKDITTLKSGALTIYGNNKDATVTVTTDKKAVESGKDDAADDGNKEAGDEDDDTTGGEQTTPPDEEETPTLPTKVTLIDFIGNKYDDTKRETVMTKSATDGNWTCELTISNQWPNFNVKATFGENDALYKGGEVKLNESGTITKNGSNDIWCNVGEKCDGAKISVTVNFTGTTQSIKIAIVEEGTKGEDDKQPSTMPTAVVLYNKIDGSNWTKTPMTKSETDGIWTCEMTISNQWPNFQVITTFGEDEVWYKGGEINLGESVTITKDGSGDIWCNVGEDNKNAKILVTVDFTGYEPTIKLELAK